MSKPPLLEVMQDVESSDDSDFTSHEARLIIAVRDWIKKARLNIVHGN